MASIPPQFADTSLQQQLTTARGLSERLGRSGPELYSGIAALDECFADVTGCFQGKASDFADLLRKEIRKTLGFTVNIGVSNCKLLSKTASGFSKPDKTHELYSNELKEKYFPLPP